MHAFKSLLLGAALAMGAPAVACGAVATVKVPPGVGTRMTAEGPVYTDARGMTLYKGDAACTGDRLSRVRPIDAEGDVQFNVTAERAQSCLEKTPPLLAPAGARPVGKWTPVLRPEGFTQWAYDNELIYTSRKDKVPGDVNGSYLLQLARGQSRVLYAPVAGLPAGVKLRETVGGLTLTDVKGRSLYVRASGKCDAACGRDWRPLAAPAIADAGKLAKGWSIVSETPGVKQWAYRGRALYTYAHDAAAHGEQVFGDVFGETWGQPIRGWDVAVVIPAPANPPGVVAQTLSGETQLFSFGLAKVVYATTKGQPLYTMHCVDGGDDEDERGGGVACDDVGDDPRYWLTACGGEQACARTWRPLPAAAAAKPIGNAWTVTVINPANPFAPVVGGGQRVWAYKGRPVFTYAGDRLPGDFYGDDHGFGTTGAGQMQARPIPAQAFAPQIRPPVMAVARSEAGRRR